MSNVIHFGYCSFEFPDHWSKKERRIFTAMAGELAHIDYTYIKDSVDRVYYAREENPVVVRSLPVWSNLDTAKRFIESEEARRRAKEQA